MFTLSSYQHRGTGSNFKLAVLKAELTSWQKNAAKNWANSKKIKARLHCTDKFKQEIR